MYPIQTILNVQFPHETGIIDAVNETVSFPHYGTFTFDEIVDYQAEECCALELSKSKNTSIEHLKMIEDMCKEGPCCYNYWGDYPY